MYESALGGGSEEGPLLAAGGSIEVIFRAEGSVRTSAFSPGLTGREDDEEDFDWKDGGLKEGFGSVGLWEPGRRD